MFYNLFFIQIFLKIAKKILCFWVNLSLQKITGGKNEEILDVCCLLLIDKKLNNFWNFKIGAVDFEKCPFSKTCFREKRIIQKFSQCITVNIIRKGHKNCYIIFSFACFLKNVL